mgnify:CR=1 FL=1
MKREKRVIELKDIPSLYLQAQESVKQANPIVE